jgi:hypothetical protein
MRIHFFVASILSTFVGLAGCTAPTSQQEEEETAASSEEPLNAGWNLSDGFYRVDRGAAVYMINGYSNYCWVYDPGQLDALGHARGMSTNVLNLASFGGVSGWASLSWRNYTGTCAYPDGMYRRESEQAVYLVTGNSYCWVRDNDQVSHHGGWRAVYVIDRPVSEAKFQDGRTFSGTCAW